MNRRKAALGLATILIATITAACGSEDTTGADSDFVKLVVPPTGPLQPSMAMQASAPEVLGYWSDEGVEIDDPTIEGAAAMQMLATGEIDAVVVTASQAVATIAAGAPVKIIASYVNTNIWRPYVPVDSDIQSPEDFEGKVIGVHSLDSGGVPMFDTLMSTVGMSNDDVDIVAAGTGADVVALFEAGRIDAYSASDGHQALIQAEMPTRPVSNEEFDDIGFHVAIAVNTESLETKREALVGYLRGVYKSVAVARANPEAVVAMLYGQHEELRPAGMETAEIIEQLTPGLEARLENMSPVDGLDGNADVSQIEGHVEAMVESGTFELPSGQSVEEFVKDFWDPSLLEEANDFDKAALMAEAEQWSWDDFIE